MSHTSNIVQPKDSTKNTAAIGVIQLIFKVTDRVNLQVICTY